MALDSSGNLYIADGNNARIQFVAKQNCSSNCPWGLSSTTADYIYTIAGSSSGTSGSSGDGGRASLALLNAPIGIRLDASNNLYIADYNNNRIQFVAAQSCSSNCPWGLSSTTADYIYTIAGSSSGTSGSSGDGGPATSALLHGPRDVGVDSSGNLYVADSGNNEIRLAAAAAAFAHPLTPGDITTFAGNGTSGSAGANGPAYEAEISNPQSIVTDSSGNVYITDAGNDRILEVAASSHSQFGIAMTAGDAYVVAGTTGSSGNSGDGGPATAAKLGTGASGTAIDGSGNLYISDSGNNQIRFVAGANCASNCPWGLSSTTAGYIYTIAGSTSGTAGTSGAGGPATSALLDNPIRIALDSSGDIYIPEWNDDEIQFVAKQNCSSSCPWGLSSTTAGYIYNIAGGAVGTGGDGGPATSADLNAPREVALDSSGNLYIADGNNARIQFVAKQNCSSNCPWGLSSTTADYIYTIAGSSSGTSGSSGDGGRASLALLNAPIGIRLDASNNLYIADYNNNRIQFVAAQSCSSNCPWGLSSTTADYIYTIAGSSSGTSGSSGDGGPATSALLHGPRDVGVDSSGNLYVADSGNVKIRLTATTPGQYVSTPGGYTLVASETAGGTTTSVFSHEVGASDTGVTLNYALGLPKVATLAVYTGGTATPVDATGLGATAWGATLPVPSVQMQDSGDRLVYFAGAGGQSAGVTWTPPSGLTSRTSQSITGASSVLADAPAMGLVAPWSSTTSSAAGELSGVEVAVAGGGGTSTTTYNADDQVVVSTDADGNSTLTCYDPDGSVVETVPAVGIDEENLQASSCADSALYPSGVLSNGTEVMPLPLAPDATTMTFDANSDDVSMRTPAPASASSEKVSNANPHFTYDYELTTSTYDADGRPLSSSAPPASPDSGAPSQVTTESYNADGEMVVETTGNGTTASSTTVYCYDPNGDRTSVVAPDGNVSGDATCSNTFPYDTGSAYETTYSYDSVGDVVSSTAPASSAAPDGATTSDTYDASGNLLTSTDPDGVTATATYTPLDQLATVSYSGSSAHAVSDSYDAAGNLTAMSDASGNSSYVYDPFGELTSTTNGAGKTVSYSFNGLGEETGITYPLGSGATWASTDTVELGYDNAGLLDSMGDFEGNTTSISSTADEVPSSINLGSSGDAISTTYDRTDSPSAIDLEQGSTTLLGFSYANSPSGNVASETDTPSSSLEPASYDYDAQSRLTSDVAGTSASHTYTEDPSGNLTTLPTGGSASYNDASELTSSVLSSATTDYSYDADGQRTGESGASTVTASYNGAEELTSYDDSSANLSSATYDGNGLRTADTVGSTAQNFVWDPTASQPELLMDNTNAYIYGDGTAPLEQVNLSTGAVVYLVADTLGSIRGVVSSTGTLTASTDYDAWGNPETTGGLSAYTPFGFAGGYTDPTGLIYLVNRYYDPATGQFLSVDPLVAETDEPYAYTGDDPVNAVDPSGAYCISLSPGGYGPPLCLQGPPAPGTGEVANAADAFTPATLEGIAQNPWSLEGLNPEQLLQSLGLDPDNLPNGLTIRAGKSESAGLGNGWTLEQSSDGGITIRWSPGTLRAGDGVHPKGPYWKVSGGRFKTVRVPADDWENGPEPYVAQPKGQSEGQSQPDEGCLTAATFGYLTSCGGGEVGFPGDEGSGDEGAGDEGLGFGFELEGYGQENGSPSCSVPRLAAV